jgi:plastocyanin
LFRISQIIMRVPVSVAGVSSLFLSLFVGILVGGAPVSAFAETHEAEILRGSTTLGDKSFAPNPIQIASGDTIVFYNRDTVLHTATSGDGATGVASGEFDTGFLGPNRSAEVVVNGEGDIAYFCMAHPTMVGLVQVSSGPPQDETEATVETGYQDQTFAVKSTSMESVRATNLTINPGVSVVVQLEGSGGVELELPSGMIEGISSVTAADGTVVDFTKEEETDSHTRIKLQTPEGENTSVTIVGSRVVPEFPTILVLLTGSAAAAAVILGRTYGAKSFAPGI